MADVGATVERVVDKLSDQLAERGLSRVKVRTIARYAGKQRISAGFMRSLEIALRERGIYHFPTNIVNLRAEDLVLIATAPFHDRGLTFKREDQFVALLLQDRYYRTLTPFRTCTSVKVKERWGRTQVDLVFRESGGYVVCEVELRSGRDETASQVRRYVEAMRTELAKRQRSANVRAVVITGEPNPRQELELREWSQTANVRADWFYYRHLLTLEEATQLEDE